MDLERVRAIVEFYDAHLQNVGVPVRKLPLAPEVARRVGEAPEWQHLRYMFEEMRKMISEGRTEKAMRWLGFVQGVLWTTGAFSLDDLKNHSRPDWSPPKFGERQCRDPLLCGKGEYQCGCRDAEPTEPFC